MLDATSTVTFSVPRARCQGGSSTASQRSGSATLNGVDRRVDRVARTLAPARPQADNVLVVSSVAVRHTSSNGIQRTVDPSDKPSTWNSSSATSPGCLGQLRPARPQGGARLHGGAPETWTVLSNSASTSVEELPDGGRLWTFADTPPLSTYVTVVNAGPFYELRSHRGGYDLGLYSRQSLKQLLDRDAEELFEITEQGLAWFGEHFGVPFGQERYDQVFVPDLGGAMENWGCVRWRLGPSPRSTPTYEERRYIADGRAPRDGAHVVRGPGHDEVVGRPLAQ